LEGGGYGKGVCENSLQKEGGNLPRKRGGWGLVLTRGGRQQKNWRDEGKTATKHGGDWGWKGGQVLPL